MREGGDERGYEVGERRGIVGIRTRERGSMDSVKKVGRSKSSNLEEMKKERGRGGRTRLAKHKSGQGISNVTVEGEECTAVPSKNGHGKLRQNVDGRGARFEGTDNLKMIVNFREDDGGDPKIIVSGSEKKSNDGGDNAFQAPVLRQLQLFRTDSVSEMQIGDVGVEGRGQCCLQTSVPYEVPTTPVDNRGGGGHRSCPWTLKTKKLGMICTKREGEKGVGWLGGGRDWDWTQEETLM